MNQFRTILKNYELLGTMAKLNGWDSGKWKPVDFKSVELVPDTKQLMKSDN